MIILDIHIYVSASGKQPFSDWLFDLDSCERAIIRTRIDRLKLGNFGDAKQIKDGAGIWELRISHGPGYRIYYGKIGKTVVLLLLGGNKNSQRRDITAAKKYWLDYRENSNE